MANGKLLKSRARRRRLQSSPRSGSTKWTERLNMLSDILAGCKKVADGIPVPGLPAFVGIAQGIVTTLETARTNRESALRLATKVCDLLELISEQCDQAPSNSRSYTVSNPIIQAHVEKFSVTLEVVKTSVIKITLHRPWYKIVLLAFRDKRTVEDNFTKLDDAVELYRLHVLKSIENDTKEMKEEIDCLKNETRNMNHTFGLFGRMFRGVVHTLSKLEKRMENALLPKDIGTSCVEPEKCYRQSHPLQEQRPKVSRVFRLMGILERTPRPYRIVHERNRFSVHRGSVPLADTHADLESLAEGDTIPAGEPDLYFQKRRVRGSNRKEGRGPIFEDGTLYGSAGQAGLGRSPEGVQSSSSKPPPPARLVRRGRRGAAPVREVHPGGGRTPSSTARSRAT